MISSPDAVATTIFDIFSDIWHLHQTVSPELCLIYYVTYIFTRRCVTTRTVCHIFNDIWYPRQSLCHHNCFWYIQWYIISSPDAVTRTVFDIFSDMWYPHQTLLCHGTGSEVVVYTEVIKATNLFRLACNITWILWQIWTTLGKLALS